MKLRTNPSEPPSKAHALRARRSRRTFLCVEQLESRCQPATLTPDAVAAASWDYLHSDWATDNHLPWSWRSESLNGGDYANVTEIGLYALSWLGAYEMRQPWSPTWNNAEAEVTAILDQLRSWQTGTNAFQGVFYQFYHINQSPPRVGPSDNDQVVPSVDNAWLALSLLTIHQYAAANGHAAMAQKAQTILAGMDFTIWINSTTHRFYHGTTRNPISAGEWDYLANEGRIINFVTRALDQWTGADFSQSLDALVGGPGVYDGITVQNVAFDGSYFTYASPALFLRETATNFGQNTIVAATQAQMAYAENQGYLAWGLDDVFDIGAGGYIQGGSLPAASGTPEAHSGVVAPHASALAYITSLAPQVFPNLQVLADAFPRVLHAQYGFLDSVMAKLGDPQYGQASARFSALAKEWTFLALVNAKTGFIWDYLYRAAGVRQAHMEMFGNEPPLNQPPALAAIGAVIMDEGRTLNLTAKASDPDGNPLTFVLEPGAPAGAALDPSTGVLTWTAAAPGAYSITLRVTDAGAPRLSDAETFTIIVRDDVTPPRILKATAALVKQKIARLILLASEDLEPSKAADRRNYRVTLPGRDGRLGTRDDPTIRISSVRYDSATRTITIALRKSLAKSQRFRLTVRATGPLGLTDLAANALDGNKDGKPGGDFIANFPRR